MEEDPLVTQRMRDIARTQMCDSHASAYNKCGGEQVNNPPARGVFSTGAMGALAHPQFLDIFRGLFKTFELSVLTVIDCPKIAVAKEW